MLAKKAFLLSLTLLLISIFVNEANAQSGRVKQRENSQPNSLSRNPNSTNNNANVEASEKEKLTKSSSSRIPKNTLLNLHLDQSLSSKTTKKGEEFITRVSEPVIVNDEIILTSTASVKCHIISVEPAARKGKNGSITIGFDELLLDDGTKIPLRATLFSVVSRTDQVVEEDGEGKIKDPSKGRNKAGTIATQAGVGAGVGTIAGGAAGAGIGAGIGAGLGLGGVLLAKGRDIELLSGSRLQVRLDADIFLTSSTNTQ